MENQMRKIIAIAMGALILTSCGTRTVTVEKTPEVTAAPIPDAPLSSFDREQNFLNGLTYDHPTEVSRLGKASVLELGRLTCEAIDEGTTIGDFVKMAGNTGASPEFIGSLIREAVENFCPENQWFIDSALNA
jgi:hypothetical protein